MTQAATAEAYGARCRSRHAHPRTAAPRLDRPGLGLPYRKRPAPPMDGSRHHGHARRGTVDLVWRNKELTDNPGNSPKDSARSIAWRVEITELDPPYRLSISWGSTGGVTFELEPVGDMVRFTVTHHRIPELTWLNISAGWHAHIDILAARLAERSRSRSGTIGPRSKPNMQAPAGMMEKRNDRTLHRRLRLRRHPLSVSAEPAVMVDCQCRQCQRDSGTGHGSHLTFVGAPVEVTGEPGQWETVGEGGTRKSRAFCPTCGEPVYLTFPDMPDIFVPTAASLDDPGRYQPQIATWASAGQPGTISTRRSPSSTRCRRGFEDQLPLRP